MGCKRSGDSNATPNHRATVHAYSTVMSTSIFWGSADDTSESTDADLAAATGPKSALRLRCDKRPAVRRKASRTAHAANRISNVEWTPCFTRRRSHVRVLSRPSLNSRELHSRQEATSATLKTRRRLTAPIPAGEIDRNRWPAGHRQPELATLRH